MLSKLLGLQKKTTAQNRIARSSRQRTCDTRYPYVGEDRKYHDALMGGLIFRLGLHVSVPPVPIKPFEDYVENHQDYAPA
jgi:hypothetical protein